MTNKICVVTGGSRGIGRAICERLLERRYEVVFIAKNDENAYIFLNESGTCIIINAMYQIPQLLLSAAVLLEKSLARYQYL